ncbi:MAG: flagellar brake protein [Gammaproteobacteria bacterium]
MDTNGHRGLDLDIGDTLQIQFVGDDARRRYYTRVIGYLPERSLLVTTPLRDGKVLLLREGQTMVVRMLSGTSVYAFTTSILASNVRPFPYLHLSYPKDLEMIVVRKAHRARTHLVASVQHRDADANDAPSVSVVMVDVSTTGALLKSEEPIGDIGDLITVSTRVTVGEVQQYLDLPAVVRNVHEETCDDHLESSTGIEFVEIDQRDTVILHGYVYECLINE